MNKAGKKKSSTAFWVVLAVAVIGLGILVWVSGGTSVNIDASQYSYTDDEFVNPDATHTITEYSDFQCPFCGQTAPILREVKKDPRVNFEYKHFPLSQIHPYAQVAAEASECARDQNRFWAYHDVLFDNQDALAKNFLIGYAEALGLNMDEFNQCLNNREKQTVVAQDKLEGTADGVTGTPTIFVDGQLYTGGRTADQILESLE